MLKARYLPLFFFFGVVSACLPQRGLFADSRPNILLIIADDQRYEQLEVAMPQTKARIFDEGAHFTRAYATTPVCSPSRVSMLTGLYASEHGVVRNPTQLHRETMIPLIQDSGYETALFGKYINRSNGMPQDGFDHWLSFRGGGSTYFDPLLNKNGEWRPYQGYLTDILVDEVRSFLAEDRDRDKPFFAIFSPNAPHPPYEIKDDTKALFLNQRVPRNPNFDEQDLSDKSEWLEARGQKRKLRRTVLDAAYRNQLRMLWTLDEGIAEILSLLEELSDLENTCIIYVADNGRMMGEHQLVGKEVPYEEASHIPLGVRCPGFEVGENDSLVANIDIMPSILQAMNLPSPRVLSGRALQDLYVPSQLFENPWREDLLLEGWGNKGIEPFTALHTGEEVFMRYSAESSEFYDLQSDPYQLKGDFRRNDPRVQSFSERLKELLVERFTRNNFL